MAYTSSFDRCDRASSCRPKTEAGSLGLVTTGQIARVTAMLQAWSQRSHHRRDLRRLAKAGPHLLADIGTDPTATRLETSKPFWRA